MKLETFAKKRALKILADYDPKRLHRWHVRLQSVYGCSLMYLGTKFSTFQPLPVGVGQSFTAACKNMVRQLKGGALRTGRPMSPSFTVPVPKNLKAA